MRRKATAPARAGKTKARVKAKGGQRKMTRKERQRAAMLKERERAAKPILKWMKTAQRRREAQQARRERERMRDQSRISKYIPHYGAVRAGDVIVRGLTKDEM